jgi:hypothetical protein
MLNLQFTSWTYNLQVEPTIYKLNAHFTSVKLYFRFFLNLFFQLDDEDDDEEPEFRHSASFPAPIPWPPAIVSQQNQQQNDQSGNGKKKKKPGIVYLSSIPTGYNVTRLSVLYNLIPWSPTQTKNKLDRFCFQVLFQASLLYPSKVGVHPLSGTVYRAELRKACVWSSCWKG